MDVFNSKPPRCVGRMVVPMALLLGVLLVPSALAAQSDEGAVIAVVDAYHTALASGDSTTALSLLADDVTILESGGVEDKEHYRSGHLAGDMRFAAAVPRERSDITVTVAGDVAWHGRRVPRRARWGTVRSTVGAPN